MNKFIYLIALSLLIAMTKCSSGKNDPINSLEQGAYLSDGKVYIYDFLKNDTICLSLPNDSILGFSFSPTKKYIAYYKFFNYVASHECGDSDDTTTYQDQSNSIVIFDLENKKIVKEIQPGGNEFISIEKWISEDELLYVSADGEAVNGWLTYKVNDSINNLGYSSRQEELQSVVFSNDFKIKLFVDSLKALHMIDLDNLTDVKVYQTENYIYDIELTNDHKQVAWFEIKNYIDPKSNEYKTIDIIYLRSLKDNTVSEFYREKACGKSSEKCMKFAFNDSILSIELERKIQLINLFTKQRAIVEGFNAYWVNSKTLIYSYENDLNLYDVNSGKSKLFRKNASNFTPKKYAR